MPDVERGEVLADLAIIMSIALARTIGSQSSSGIWLSLRPYSASKRLADRLQIVAGIEALRDRTDVLAQRLAVAQIGGAGEHVDLGAGIVDVVLAGHRVAGEGQQVRERIAEHGAAAMADMHRPGRVGRDVFDVDLLGLAEIALAEWSGRRAIAARSASRHTFASSVRLMKPGPAISTAVISGRLRSSAAIRSASSRGLRPASLASAIAALVARSPWPASRGGSTTIRDEIGR